MDLRRAKEAYNDLSHFKGGTHTDFQRETELMELDFEEDKALVNWSVTVKDLLNYLDLEEEEQDLQDVVRECISQGLNFEEFLDEILIAERVAA